MLLIKLILSKLRFLQRIPLKIDDSEIQIRCIGHYLYYSQSKQRLKFTAFMPPNGSNEVSLLRLSFANETKCKIQAKSLKKNGYTYCGLVTIITKDILDSIEALSAKTLLYDDGSKVEVNVISTPLDENKEKRDSSYIFSNDKGLPFHSDLIYNWTPIEGKVAPTPIKQIAKYLAKNPPSYYNADLHINEIEWKEGKLKTC